MTTPTPNNRFVNLQKLLLKLLVFLLPTQLAIHFWPDSSLVNGIRVDYLSIAVYLSDVVILAFVGLFFLIKNNRQKLIKYIKQKYLVFLLFLFLVVINIVVAQEPLTAFIRWLKVGEWGLLLFSLINLDIDVEKEIKTPLALSILMIVGIGLVQIFLGRTIGGSLYLLGERTFNLYTPGISLINFSGHTLLRMYSIFPHPNALGGYLLILLPLFFVWVQKDRRIGNYLGLLGCLIGIVFAFSVNVYLSLVFALVIYFWLRHCQRPVNCATLLVGGIIVVSILLPIVSTQLLTLPVIFKESVANRLMLSRVGGYVFSQYPLAGVGLNNFLYLIPRFSSLTGFVWLLQPVHNVFLSILIETGILGLVTLFWLSSSLIRTLVTNKRGVFLFILILILLTGFNDHYWLTIQQNFFLLALVFALGFRNNQNASF